MKHLERFPSYVVGVTSMVFLRGVDMSLVSLWWWSLVSLVESGGVWSLVYWKESLYKLGAPPGSTND